jgi:hypothetical protein
MTSRGEQSPGKPLQRRSDKMDSSRPNRAGGIEGSCKLDTRAVEELVEGVLEHLAFVFQKRSRSRTSALAASSRKHREKARASGSIFEHTTTSEIDHIGFSARQRVSSAIR